MAVSNRLATCAIIVTGLVGCSPSTTGAPILVGDFTADIAGDLSASVHGTATYGTTRVSPLVGAIRWAFIFWSGDGLAYSPDIIVMSRVGALVPPQAGTYPIYDVYADSLQPGDFVATYSALRFLNRRTLFASVAGTLTIDTVIADRINGSFSFNARRIEADGESLGDSVTTDGAFTSFPIITVAVN